LEALFRLIGAQETEILSSREVKEKEFKSKKRGVSKAQLAQTLEEDEALEEEKQRAYELAVQEALGTVPAVNANVPTGLDEAGEVRTKDYRGRYYYEKFKIIPGIPDSDKYLYGLTTEYLKGLMWCLAYYIKGCVSWTWYFPYNYGPLLQDMTKCADMQSSITFTLGGPFLPFQQLLGCLPPLSRRLLPACYQWLMSSVDSPVLEFYPNDFELDQDGKKNPWEAVVILPFIDEKRLLAGEALHCPVSKLTRDERGRNAFGKVMHYQFDPKVNETYLSCNPEIGLPDVVKCNSVSSKWSLTLTADIHFARKWWKAR
jgi:5'-3' exoribonuclease 1